MLSLLSPPSPPQTDTHTQFPCCGPDSNKTNPPDPPHILMNAENNPRPLSLQHMQAWKDLLPLPSFLPSFLKRQREEGRVLDVLAKLAMSSSTEVARAPAAVLRDFGVAGARFRWPTAGGSSALINKVQRKRLEEEEEVRVSPTTTRTTTTHSWGDALTCRRHMQASRCASVCMARAHVSACVSGEASLVYSDTLRQTLSRG